MTYANRTCRVLHVVSSMNLGGTETYVLNVLRHYDRRAFQMDVCYTGAREGSLAPEVTALGSRLVGCPETRALLPFVWRATRMLTQGRYAAVCDYSGDFAAPFLLAARLAGVPARVAMYRSSYAKWRPTAARRLFVRALRREVLRNATWVLSNSHANLAARFSPAEMDHRFAVVRNGVDVARFTAGDQRRRRDARRQLGIAPEALVIGHVGSFTTPKAQDVLLNAFAQLAPLPRPVRLLLIGDGPLRRMAEQQARNLGVADHVMFAGLQRDVATLLHAMDLFVFPSRFEGFPNALIEAQACGLAVVASDRPEIREAVPAGNHDCLVRVGDSASLARKIEALLRDRAAAERRGAAGAVFVATHLQIHDSVTHLCRYFVDAVAPVVHQAGAADEHLSVCS